ncbi:MAG TPA: mevalonate kinase [Aggregatilinea sp.]|jgi:mevalonate kinase|uniref:mevalonate kinase n=1 Tax=Aggregatilinea sp. TaxID=2806333 RepID=UPI002B725DB5|nr:mevalonate kinase [Aggregatilinea sp.]HML22529.1 mevalonate kinase [Aggregatilinea sp.]
MPPSHEQIHVRPATGHAPGKIILFGEHAVVYGQPAIAAPLTAVQVTAEVEPAAPGTGITIHLPALETTLAVPDLNELLDQPLHDAVIYPVQLALRQLNITTLPDLSLTIQSTIPIASGLGSGAALAAAILRAVCAALDAPISDDALNPLVFEVEKRHHGTPSGIDNTTIVYQHPVFFVRGSAMEAVIVAQPVTLLVADSGISSSTRVTVGDVRALYDADPARIRPVLARIGALAHEARAALETGSLMYLGRLMNKNHALLDLITVSSPELDRLCAAAREAGALGAKLSGGGRGGNVIALVDEAHAEATADALRDAGAVSVVRTTIAPTG